ncbi:MAG TPA: hypothetical protein VF013_11410 [Candidatus Limnocylindria bacterium]
MEFHVRSARLTDIDSAIRLLPRGVDDAGDQRDDADRLRSLLFLPATTVVVAEAERRVIGLGVLSIRPAVRSGSFIGVIDALGISGEAALESDGDAADAVSRDAVGRSILEHLLASARNKGCARVEVTDPLAAAEPELLESAGFAPRGVLLSRAVG